MKHLLPLCLVACSTPAPHARFANQPPVETVDDRRDVRVVPKKRAHTPTLYYFDAFVHRQITRGLELPEPKRALGVNAMDEVPNSTWFTNRIGVRDLTPDEIRRGPSTIDSPELHKPWTIISSKVGGTAPGFLIEDARGEKFLLKPDILGYPELETGTDVIVQRILWAAGYNVPENHIVYFTPNDITVAKDAQIEDQFGTKRPLDRAGLDERFKRVEFGADGRMRAMASRLIAGKPIGGHPQEGTRADDPNDRIPHERRRDLRGGAPIFAWLDHTDLTEDNTLDVWVTDAADPTRHYVKHYLLDFGKSLGVMGFMAHDRRRSYEYRFDYEKMFASLITMGITERDWEDRDRPPIRGVGLIDVQTYNPGTWRMSTQSYVPVVAADARDKFWGSKIMMRFTREHIRAAIQAARLTDPLAERYLLDVLVARQRETAAYWFERVAPLDKFAIENNRVCFTDLSLHYGLIPHSITRYAARYRDDHENVIANAVGMLPDSTGRACVPLDLARAPNGYNIIELRVQRWKRERTVFVHVARDANGARVIGIWRP